MLFVSSEFGDSIFGFSTLNVMLMRVYRDPWCNLTNGKPQLRRLARAGHDLSRSRPAERAL